MDIDRPVLIVGSPKAVQGAVRAAQAALKSQSDFGVVIIDCPVPESSEQQVLKRNPIEHTHPRGPKASHRSNRRS